MNGGNSSKGTNIGGWIHASVNRQCQSRKNEDEKGKETKKENDNDTKKATGS